MDGGGKIRAGEEIGVGGNYKGTGEDFVGWWICYLDYDVVQLVKM